MDKKLIVGIVVAGLLVVSEVVGHIRIGGKAGREAVDKLESEWQLRDGDYEMELERMAGEWVKMGLELEVYKRRMDTLRGEWAVKGKKVGSIEDWFRANGK